jgi:hypothetical protein
MSISVPLPMANNMKVKRFVIKEGLEQGSPDFVDFEAKKKQATFEGYDPEEVAKYSKEIASLFAKILVLPEFKIDGQAHWINDLGRRFHELHRNGPKSSRKNTV